MTLTKSASQVSIRRLESRDVSSAMELSSEAGWNQLPEDWATLIELSPEGCLTVEIDGILASTATLVCYGKELAWIGMVLTRPEFRGRGYARLLLERVLMVADEKHVASVKLDATEQGIHLYKKLGFRKEQMVERWTGNGLSSGIVSPEACHEMNEPETEEELDRKAIGAGRGPLLKALARRSKTLYTLEGFAMQRPGRVTRYLGPCVAGNGTTARKLIKASLLSDSGRWSWDIPSTNLEATKIAGELGFKVERRLTRMVRGSSLSGNTGLLFAIAGFEIG